MKRLGRRSDAARVKRRRETSQQYDNLIVGIRQHLLLPPRQRQEELPAALLLLGVTFSAQEDRKPEV